MYLNFFLSSVIEIPAIYVSIKLYDRCVYNIELMCYTSLCNIDSYKLRKAVREEGKVVKGISRLSRIRCGAGKNCKKSWHSSHRMPRYWTRIFHSFSETGNNWVLRH